MSTRAWSASNTFLLFSSYPHLLILHIRLNTRFLPVSANQGSDIHSMAEESLAHEISPDETYQIDSDDYDSDQERDDLDDEEYEKLVDEGELLRMQISSHMYSIRLQMCLGDQLTDGCLAENGYSDEEMKAFTHQLKESGLVNFLRDYLTPNENPESRSLRKLLLGFGIIPVSATIIFYLQ